ncbi:MAG: gliding motility protein GldC [Bacteroidota bacterium]|jgi:gliding motility-associated protein GldC
MKKSTINFEIELDEQQIPDKMLWSASDSGMVGPKPCKATMIGVWDAVEGTTMRIDLWSKDMFVEDMKLFFYENLASMADTYERATNDKTMAEEMRNFSKHFGKKAGILK